MTPCLTRRVNSGLALSDQLGGVDVLFCGGQTNPHHFVKEADIMAAYAREIGCDDDIIHCEGQSRNTLENAIFAKRMIQQKGWDDLWVVSDRPHLLRARMVFRTLGLKARFVAAAQAPHGGLGHLKMGVYEIPALFWYGIRLISGHHRQYKEQDQK